MARTNDTSARLPVRVWLASGAWLAIAAALPASEPGGAAKPVSVIAFGSCIKQAQPMPILETIAKDRPEIMIFTGDNIYGDTDDMQILRQKYAQLGANPAFQRLKRQTQFYATWDDHDYGINDGGADYPRRAESQSAFHDFWGTPANDARRKRAGVYRRVTLGPPEKRLQIILLDTRYFRSTLKQGERRVGGPYYPDEHPDKTMLGAEQWKWLKETLEQPAEIRVLVTSIQCLAEAAGQETWSNLPRERQRLLDLIRQTKAGGVVMISGDRHWSELSSIDIGYPLVELTCSSLNQKHPRGTPTANRSRVSPRTFHDVNYGVLQIDWDAADPTIRMEIRNLQGESQIQWSDRLSKLQQPHKP